MIRITLLSISLLLAAQAIAGGLFRMETETLYQMKTGENQESEQPFYQFLQADYQSQRDDFSFMTNFGYHSQFDGSSDDFNLYILNFDYTVVPKRFKFYAGRNFHPFSTVSSSLSDRVGGELLLLNNRLTFGAYVGEERRILYGQELTTGSQQVGTYAHYRTSDLFPITVSLKHEYNNYEVFDRGTQNMGELALHKKWAGSWGVETLLDVEAVLDEGREKKIEGGIDLYPSPSWVLSIRALKFRQNSLDEWEAPIFTIFSEGDLYEQGLRIGHQWSKSLFLSVALSYDEYLKQDSEFAYGYKAELNIDYSHRLFQIENTIYSLESVGGSAIGNRAQIQTAIIGGYDAYFGFETTYYEKLTDSKRYAWSSYVGLGSWLWNQFKLSLTGEVLANNDSQSDYRLTAQLNYMLWKEVQ